MAAITGEDTAVYVLSGVSMLCNFSGRLRGLQSEEKEYNSQLMFGNGSSIALQEEGKGSTPPTATAPQDGESSNTYQL